MANQRNRPSTADPYREDAHPPKSKTFTGRWNRLVAYIRENPHLVVVSGTTLGVLVCVFEYHMATIFGVLMTFVFFLVGSMFLDTALNDKKHGILYFLAVPVFLSVGVFGVLHWNAASEDQALVECKRGRKEIRTSRDSLSFQLATEKEINRRLVASEKD